MPLHGRKSDANSSENVLCASAHRGVLGPEVDELEYAFNSLTANSHITNIVSRVQVLQCTFVFCHDKRSPKCPASVWKCCKAASTLQKELDKSSAVAEMPAQFCTSRLFAVELRYLSLTQSFSVISENTATATYCRKLDSSAYIYSCHIWLGHRLIIAPHYHIAPQVCYRCPIG